MGHHKEEEAGRKSGQSARRPQKSNALVEFYRCPEDFAALSVAAETNLRPGFFRFGPEAICYGQSALASPVTFEGNGLPDVARNAAFHGSTLHLPFDVSAIVDNLRLERYPTNTQIGVRTLLSSEGVRQLYYYFRPSLSDELRQGLQRFFFRKWEKLPFPRWPVDTSVEQLFETLLLLSMQGRGVDRVPFIWFWPDGALASAIVTHDVETDAGINFVRRLMDVDEAFGIKASYQIVPEERYPVPRDLLSAIREQQCEVNVHGLNHDGNLFRNRQTFLKQCKRINHYIQAFEAEGYRSACMYRNAAWYDELDVSYDMSVPNVAHLEPQRGGCCTVFPYFIDKILELPLTTAQDYSLFHILGDYSIELWKEQIKRIWEKHGLISFIVHPDYVLEKKALSVYKALLAHLSELRAEKKIWMSRPGDVNRWWRERSTMKLVLQDGRWRIEGQGRERARIAFARIQDDRIVYTVEGSSEAAADDPRETF
jgi:hypothetical protein